MSPVDQSTFKLTTKPYAKAMFIPPRLSSKARRNGAIIFAIGLTTFLTVAATKPKPGQEDLRAVSGGAGLLCMVLGGGILAGTQERQDLSEQELSRLPPLERNRKHLERCYKLKRKKERKKRKEG